MDTSPQKVSKGSKPLSWRSEYGYQLTEGLQGQQALSWRSEYGYQPTEGLQGQPALSGRSEYGYQPTDIQGQPVIKVPQGLQVSEVVLEVGIHQ